MDHEQERFLRLESLAYAAIATGVVAALLYVTVAGMGSWAQVVVLAGIVLATIGVMLAVDPLKRE